MTKKDYELIASEIKNQHELLGYYAKGVYEMACKLWAATLSAQNPLFDKDKFLKACNACNIYSNGRQNGNYDWICKTHDFSMSYISSEKPTTCHRH